jgi:hypothetical protein
MFRKALVWVSLAIFPVAAAAQTTSVAPGKHSPKPAQPFAAQQASIRQQKAASRPARTPLERLLIPYLQKRLKGNPAAPESIARTNATSSTVAPNFGGYLGAPYYPAHAEDACTIDPANCGVGTALIADYDKDGKEDVAVVQFDGTLNILLGDGHGGFAAPAVYSNPNYSTTEMQQALAVDLNNDGYTDLVALDEFNNALLIYLNQKNGAFAAPVSIDLTSNYGFVNCITLGDVNGDGKVDVVTLAANITSRTTTDVTVQTYLGNGDGTFQSTATYTGTVTVPAQVNMPGNLGITLGDVNGDGKLDLAADFLEYTSQTTGAVVASVALGDGAGNFGALNVNNPVNVPFVAVGAPFVIVVSSGVQLVDLNQDSKLDLAVDGGGSFYVAIGNGSGNFAAPVQTTGIPSPGQIDEIVYGDFNGDGIPDMAVEEGLLGIWLGKGDGTFNYPTAQYIVDSGPTQDLAVYDFNGDGKLDVAQLGGDYKQLSFFSGNGDGTAHGAPALSPTFDPVPSPTLNVLSAVGDLNGDGFSDVVMIDEANYANNEVEIATGLSDGKGNFTYQSALSPSLLDNLSFIQPFTADFNKDGKQDILLANIDGTLAVALSAGNGTFQTPALVALPTLGCPVSYTAAADVNGDGNLDLVIPYGGDASCGSSGSAGSGYFVALGKGNGTFSTPTFTPFGTQLYSATLADMNGDGKLDLLLDDAPFLGGTFAVDLLSGNGDGTFTPGQAVVSDYLISQVTVADYNNDGKPDLVLFSEGEQSDMDAYKTAGIMLLPGNGDGTFGAPNQLATGNYFLNGAVVDVNGDGIPDIEGALYQVAGPPNTYYGFSVLLGEGDGGFSAPVNMLEYLLSETPLPGYFTAGNAPSFVVATPAGPALYLGQGGISINLTASSSSVSQGQSVTFTATVAAAISGRPAPTGSVSFYDGTTLLGSAPISGSVATFTTSGLAVGSHSITAVYGGDGNFNFVTSSAVPVTVTSVSPGFTLTPSPASLTIPRGQNGVASLTLTANAAFSGTVALTCSGLPANATCTLSPASVGLAAGGSATSTLVIGTTTSAALHNPLDRSPWKTPAGVVSLAALLWVFARRRSLPRLFSVLLLGALASAAMSLTACGGGSVKAAPVGTYKVTITATPASSTASSQTTIVSVTIQ